MAEDTEKRFHSIMDKLFHSSKSNLPFFSSSSSVQNTKGQKRPYSAMEPNSKDYKGERIPNAAEAPPCRPWDRGDLMRRLATFKSMRWFAKPKVVNAVNCARRGWVNVDMDIIACEICGTRLQFSTPSTWSQQQVEKAALVFSLKLDTGHKLLCPWIDNACDENLALFPPMQSPVLVHHYKERSSALLKLSALPVISSSVIGSMRNSQLEQFLKQSIAVECGTGPDGCPWTDYLGTDDEALSADLYYQAHRLLSLCGWEPRLLPYVVDDSDQPKQSASSAEEQNKRWCVYTSSSGESLKENGNPMASGVYYDPNSTVLDCKLCGASIGLWAFSTVPRPLELVRVVGYDEIGSKNSVTEDQPNNEKSREKVLNLTIAGGPPPTKQNFRATISLPIVGRNVRSRFSYESSEIRITSKEGHESHNTIMVGSIEDIHNGETGSSNDNNLPAIEDVGIVNGNGVENELQLPSTIVDDSSNLQQISADSALLKKDTSSVPSGEEKEDADMRKTSLQKDVFAESTDKDLRRPPLDKKMEFDPIRQHRHFCPWVASTKTTAPGWQQTLSALQKEKVFSLPESKDSPLSPSPSLIKVDDPITSIRKLFESPPAKRAKPA